MLRVHYGGWERNSTPCRVACLSSPHILSLHFYDMYTTSDLIMISLGVLVASIAATLIWLDRWEDWKIPKNGKGMWTIAVLFMGAALWNLLR